MLVRDNVANILSEIASDTYRNVIRIETFLMRFTFKI